MKDTRSRAPVRQSDVRLRLLAVLALLLLAPAAPLRAQGDADISLVRGRSTVLSVPGLQRLAIGDPEIAEAVAVSPSEILVNARAVGTTTLFVWDQGGRRRSYDIEVMADVGALQRSIQALFPGEAISVSAAGGVVVLNGRVSNSGIARRAAELAEGTGATVINNLVTGASQQVLLKVRFAEVSRRAVTELDSRLFASDADRFDEIGHWEAETLSDGLLRLFLLDAEAEFSAVLNWLKTKGYFKSLAEPNLLALDGEEAYFLAGGEFPFPTPQPGAGGDNQVVLITWKEFGVKLRFTPTITPGGRIRLHVAPEVSDLDFTTGIRLSGFDIPSFTTRRAETEVELRPGQTLAIAGLIDNSTLRNSAKIPILGDIPIIGELFRSREVRQERTELLVLVTPELVEPSDEPIPVPTGEPETWNRDRFLRGGPDPENPGPRE